MLAALVVVAGMATMAVEMAASRLLAPYFGTSLYIWGLLIGFLLICLAVGYWVGGNLADRHPNRRTFLATLALSAVTIAVIAFAAPPTLNAAQSGTAGWPYGVLWGALIGCIVLFAIPTLLLGALNPFAIRLSVDRLDKAGNAAGNVFALTTLGSLVGTFGSVFLLIPNYGTRATLLLAAAITLAAALLGNVFWREAS